MPTQEHDLLAELFRDEPNVVKPLTANLGIQVPEHDCVRAVSESFTDLKTTELTSDTAILLEHNHRPVQGILVEVQRGRDTEKRFSWPVYQAIMRHRHRCPVTLLVIAPDPKIAAWCAQPIHTGHPGYVLHPLVPRPEHIPLITDPDEIIANQTLAILSAAFHADTNARDKLLQAHLEATQTIHQTDPAQAKEYLGVLSAVLSPDARRSMEVMLKTDPRPYRMELFQNLVAEGEARGKIEGEARGKAEGEARSVIKVLKLRGVDVPDAARERILSCTDLDQLDTWLTRAMTATSVDQLFD